jgi:ABC-type phosphate transport system substrate-binding protein
MARRARLVGATAFGVGLCLVARSTTAGVVAVVSAANPVAALSRNQVVDIFLGRVSRFPDGTAAVPVDQAEGSPAREEFYLEFAGKSPAQLKAHWSKIIFTGRGQPPKEVGNGVALKKRVAENPMAIGYLEESQVDSSVKVVLTQ